MPLGTRVTKALRRGSFSATENAGRRRTPAPRGGPRGCASAAVRRRAEQGSASVHLCDGAGARCPVRLLEGPSHQRFPCSARPIHLPPADRSPGLSPRFPVLPVHRWTYFCA